jgi:Ca2+-binding EF-hand superfamily protein
MDKLNKSKNHSISDIEENEIEDEDEKSQNEEEELEDIEVEDEEDDNSLKNLRFENYYNIKNLDKSNDENDDYNMLKENRNPNNKNRFREIISYLKGQKSGLRVSELNKVFEKLDIDGDKKISSAEIKQFLNSLRTPLNDYFIQKLVKEFDANNDGEIQKGEFMERMRIQKDKVYGNELTELLEVFKLFDANEDNKICVDDLQNVMNALGENFSDETVKDMMKYISGNTGSIDFSRFFDLVKEEGKKDIFY